MEDFGMFMLKFNMVLHMLYSCETNHGKCITDVKQSFYSKPYRIGCPMG